MKRFFCLLLSLMLLCAAAVSLAETVEETPAETAAEDAETPAETAEEPAEGPAEEPAEDAAPVLLVTVNGEDIYTDNADLKYWISSYLSQLSSSGYDITDQSLVADVKRYSLSNVISLELIKQKAAEYGLNEFTDEEKAAMKDEAVKFWEDYIEEYMTSQGGITEASSDDDKAAARADAEAVLKEYGYDTLDSFVDEYVDSTVTSQLTNRIIDRLTEGKTVSDEEVQNYFNDLVKEDQEIYADIATYEYYTKYFGHSSYYMPEGYRGITHILLNVDEELLKNWQDLTARLEEQMSAQEAESTEAAVTEAPEAEPTAETADAEPSVEPAEAEATPEPTAEPVTQEMVDAAEKAILDSVQPLVDEIMEKFNAGTSFDQLIQEYGQDPGMQDDATRAEGYPVHQDSIVWDPAFTKAAMALEKIGDVSDPVVGQSGVHILHYLRDIPGGPVELTDEMKAEFLETLTDEMKNDALNTALEDWLKEANLVWTEAGEEWKMQEEETPAEETAEEETPAEETPVEETPAEETTVEETPAEETTVEETPAE